MSPPPPNQVNCSSKEAEHPHYLPFPVLDQHPRPMIWREVGMRGMVAASWLRCQTLMVLIKVQLFFLNKGSQFLYGFGHFLESCNASPFYHCFCGKKSALFFTTIPWRFTVHFCSFQPLRFGNLLLNPLSSPPSLPLIQVSHKYWKHSKLNSHF